MGVLFSIFREDEEIKDRKESKFRKKCGAVNEDNLHGESKGVIITSPQVRFVKNQVWHRREGTRGALRGRIWLVAIQVN